MLHPDWAAPLTGVRPGLRALGMVAVVASLTLAAGRPAPAADQIILHGSDTMVTLNRELAAKYAERNPQVQFTVVGGGSEGGIRALMSNATDIAAASRAMKPAELRAFAEEAGTRPMEHVVALDGIAVYVHNNNPISRLNLDQLRQILTGHITNWRDVGGLNRRIDIYNRNKDSGTRTYVREFVLAGEDFAERAYDVSTTALLTAAVSRNQSGMGYGGVGYSQGARVIRLSPKAGEPALWPTRENVSSGRYPLSRPLYFYVHPTASTPQVKRFMDWVHSDAGREVVLFAGYYPPRRATPEPAPPEPAPPAPRSPILLTPENMQTHGFAIEMAVHDADPNAETPRRRVTVRFAPQGHAIERISDIRLEIGEGVVVPLELDDRQTLRFALSERMIDESRLRLAEPGAPDEGSVYIVPLARHRAGE